MMAVRPFHIALHARPDAANLHATQTGETLEVRGVPLTTWSVAVDQQSRLMDTTFEQAYESLESLPRMFIELDGSFVWVAKPDAARAWQIDGHLWDRGGRLISVELKGWLPERDFNKLLEKLGWSRQPFIFRLVELAVFLDEREFRRYAFGA